jgi:hypothetical protein
MCSKDRNVGRLLDIYYRFRNVCTPSLVWPHSEQEYFRTPPYALISGDLHKGLDSC